MAVASRAVPTMLRTEARTMLEEHAAMLEQAAGLGSGPPGEMGGAEVFSPTQLVGKLYVTPVFPKQRVDWHS